MKIGLCKGHEEAGAFAKAGGDFMELSVQRFLKPLEDDATFEQSLRIAEDCPLPIITANGFIPSELRSTGTHYNPDGILAYAQTAFARAEQIGIKHIVFGSGGSRQIKDGFPVDEATEQFVGLLKQMGPIAANHEVIVVIEPLRTEECNFINTVAEGAAICRKTDHPNIQLLADVYHMMQNGESPRDIVNAGVLIKHVHIAENQKRTCPGIEGTDFIPWYQALGQIGYAGSVSIEGNFPNGVEADAPKAVTVTRAQMAAAGIR